MRKSILLVFVACSKTTPSPLASPSASSATVASASASASTVSSASAVSSDPAETDFQGAFNGAKLVATFEVKSGSVSGTCFYEAVGVDIPIKGTAAPDGALTLNEMKGDTAISTITLARGADGTLTGTWKTADKSGPATLSPIARKAGEPVTVVKRPLSESSDAICGWNGTRYTRGTLVTTKPLAPCRRTGSVPVVLGLADRAFQKKVDDALLEAARMQPPDNPAGLGIEVTWSTEMNARGILSVIFTGRYLEGKPCPKGAPGSDCSVDLYAPSHEPGTTASTMAAIDRAVIATKPTDFIDLSKVRSVIKPIVDKGFAACVASGDDGDPVNAVEAAVLTEQGVKIETDTCVNHTHSRGWDLIPYAKLAPALKAGTPFEAAWSAK